MWSGGPILPSGEVANTAPGSIGETDSTAAPLITPVGSNYSTDYSDLLRNNIVNCLQAACNNSLDLQKYDIAMWEGQLTGFGETLAVGGNPVGGLLNANGCIVELSSTIASCPPAPAPSGNTFSRMLRISVAWQGTDDTGDPANSGANMTCGAGLYRSAASRRLVTTDLNNLENCP